MITRASGAARDLHVHELLGIATFADQARDDRGPLLVIERSPEPDRREAALEPREVLT